MEVYPRGQRELPTKQPGELNRAWVQIPPPPPNILLCCTDNIYADKG